MTVCNVVYKETFYSHLVLGAGGRDVQLQLLPRRGVDSAEVPGQSQLAGREE